MTLRTLIIEAVIAVVLVVGWIVLLFTHHLDMAYETLTIVVVSHTVGVSATTTGATNAVKAAISSLTTGTKNG